MRVGGLARSMASTLGLRALIFPLSAVCSLTAQGLMIREIGVAGFGVVALIVTLPQLIPFADLGLSTAVTNAYARHRDDPARLVRVAWTLLWACGAALVAICLLVYATVGWDALLGVDLSSVPAPVMMLFIACIAMNIPLGVGQRILIGVGKVTRSVALGAIQPLLYVSFIFFATQAHRPDLYYLGLGSSQVVTSAAILVAASRSVGITARAWLRPTIGSKAQRRLLYSSAGPMMVVTAGLPVALESHRLVLAHMSGEHELGVYSVAMALYAPTWALVTTMGLNLWPYFAQHEDRHVRSVQYRRVLTAFAIMAGVGAVAFALLAPWVTLLWSGHRVPTLNWWVLALLLLVQTVHLPAGMLLTEPRELTVQAVCVVLMAVATITSMLAVVPALGAPGPTLCSAVSIAVFQLVPCALIASGKWSPRLLGMGYRNS